MRTDLLIKLAQRLMCVKGPINMRDWVEPIECGTAGCAAYFASHIPECQSAGLEPIGHGPGERRTPVVRTPVSVVGVYYGFDALAHVFGLTLKDTFTIFDSDEYPEYLREADWQTPVPPNVIAGRILSIVGEELQGSKA